MRSSKLHRLSLALGAVHSAHCWWQPPTLTSWQIDLSNAADVKAPFPSVDAYDADLFDVSSSQWSAVKSAGVKTICYFSAGSWENWRPDKNEFNKSDIGKPLDGWPGERWLNVTSPNVRQIMTQRLDLAKNKGCDAVDPDNVDAYQNGGGGFHLTAADAVNYVQFLASEAHARGMACGLKNALSIVPQLIDDVDFAVNEQCVQYQECNHLYPFTTSNKPVFGIEYPKPPITQSKITSVCNSKYRPRNFETLVKYLNLNSTYWACPISTTASKAANVTTSSTTSSSITSSTTSSSTMSTTAAANGATGSADLVKTYAWMSVLGVLMVML